MGFCTRCVGIVVLAVAVGVPLGGMVLLEDLFELVDFRDPMGGIPALVRDLDEQCNFDDVPAGSLAGQVGIVTGVSSTNLGFYTALHMARKGATVAIGCRNPAKCEAAAKRANGLLAAANAKDTGSVVPFEVDQSSMASVRAFTDAFKARFDRLDVLVHNAGMGVQYQMSKTPTEGIEAIWQVNMLAGAQMTSELLGLLTAHPERDVRVVAVSSSMHFSALPDKGVHLELAAINDEASYDGQRAYGSSKLGQLLWAQALAAKTPDNVRVNIAHPGAVDTLIWDPPFEEVMDVVLRAPVVGPVVVPLIRKAFNSIKSNLMWSPEEGARTQFFLAADPKVRTQDINGKYFHPVCKEIRPSHFATNDELRAKLWTFTEETLASFGYPIDQ